MTTPAAPPESGGEAFQSGIEAITSPPSKEGSEHFHVRWWPRDFIGAISMVCPLVALIPTVMFSVTAIVSVVAVVVLPLLVSATPVTFVIPALLVPFSVISVSSDANLDHHGCPLGRSKIRIVAIHRLQRE